jgi:Ser/Thr protein kinase RdoA (MazF antagonist)
LDQVWAWGRAPIIDSHAPFPWLPSERRGLVREASACLQQRLDRLYADPTGLRFLHLDLHAGNLLRHRQELHVLDFDDSAWAFPIQDMAISICNLRLRSGGATLDEPFIAGYGEVRPFPARGQSELEVFVAARTVEHISFAANHPDYGEHDLVQAIEQAEPHLRRLLASL